MENPQRFSSARAMRIRRALELHAPEWLDSEDRPAPPTYAETFPEIDAPSPLTRYLPMVRLLSRDPMESRELRADHNRIFGKYLEKFSEEARRLQKIRGASGSASELRVVLDSAKIGWWIRRMKFAATLHRLEICDATKMVEKSFSAVQHLLAPPPIQIDAWR